MMRLIVITFGILLLSFLGVSFTYELKFCQDFPRAQSCAWAHALGVTKP